MIKSEILYLKSPSRPCQPRHAVVPIRGVWRERREWDDLAQKKNSFSSSTLLSTAPPTFWFLETPTGFCVLWLRFWASLVSQYVRKPLDMLKLNICRSQKHHTGLVAANICKAGTSRGPRLQECPQQGAGKCLEAATARALGDTVGMANSRATLSLGSHCTPKDAYGGASTRSTLFSKHHDVS